MRTDTTSRSKFSRQSLQLILPVVATAWLAAPTLSNATPINYTFSSNASVTFSDGNAEAISGTFTADTATTTLSNISITLTGPTPEEGTYNNSVLFTGNNMQLTGGGAEFVNLVFTSPLNISPDPLSSNTAALICCMNNHPFGVNTSSISGSAIFASSTAAPEPSALALLITALAGLFLFRSWANRRDRRSHPHQPETA
jgi:hypothetical protein